MKLEGIIGKHKLHFKNAMIHYPLSKKKASLKQLQSSTYVTSQVKSLNGPEDLILNNSEDP